MREIIITLFLIIGAAIAEEAGIGEAIKPAEEAGVGEAIKTAEEAGIGEAIKPAEEAGVGKDGNPMFNRQAEEGYESARFKKFVTHCSSHVAETCSGSESLHDESGEWGLASCLFDSMESCLVDHGASLYETTPANKNLFKPTQVTLPPLIRGASTSKQQREYPKSTRYLPLLIETVKFRTALKTCTHVTAQTCFTPPNVAASLLPTCLAPFLNQCLYPTANSLPMGPSS